MKNIEDACQEVFIECFRVNGPLQRVDHSRSGGFRAFLYGITRNVARRMEHREGSGLSRATNLPEADCLESKEKSVSHSLDRAWAVEIVKAAAHRQEELARLAGDAAVRRWEILRLRCRMT